MACYDKYTLNNSVHKVSFGLLANYLLLFKFKYSAVQSSVIAMRKKHESEANFPHIIIKLQGGL